MIRLKPRPAIHSGNVTPDPNRPLVIGALVGTLLVVTSVALFWMFGAEPGGTPTTAGAVATTLPVQAPSSTLTVTTRAGVTTTLGPTTEPTLGPTIPVDPPHRWVDRRTVGEPWGNAVQGLITFRGNPTATFYGVGPVPSTPEIKWSYPDNGMCSQSTDLGVTTTWCGNGWTGQPLVWERPDGLTELIFGAYDRRLHFVDAATGTPTRSTIQTGDIIKGTPTLDPDGYPLVYFGSRDNRLRIVALDRSDPIVLWQFQVCLPGGNCPEGADDQRVEGQWNDDFDASPRIVNDFMFEGAENGHYYVWKLNRAVDELGLVTVDPELVFTMPTFDADLLAEIGPAYPAISVENTTAIYEGRAYFANSAGRVIGLDITDIENGNAPIVFDYWVGDDVDASIVVDEDGMLYVSAEYERYLDRAKTLGQLVKLDPYTDGDPYLWGMYSLTEPPAKGGMWATPALGDGVLYTVTNKGFLVAVDTSDGSEEWIYEVSPGSWASPVIVDDRLVVASSDGLVRNFDITEPFAPRLLWTFQVGNGSPIEATPAVWKGRVYVGSRDGFMYSIGDANSGS